jgi:MFS family permease
VQPLGGTRAARRGELIVTLDVTIVQIALPSVQRALHFSTDSRQWIITAYALAFGSLLLFGGKLGELFGRKWTFIAGLAGFAIAFRNGRRRRLRRLQGRRRGTDPHLGSRICR